MHAACLSFCLSACISVFFQLAFQVGFRFVSQLSFSLPFRLPSGLSLSFVSGCFPVFPLACCATCRATCLKPFFLSFNLLFSLPFSFWLSDYVLSFLRDCHLVCFSMDLGMFPSVSLILSHSCLSSEFGGAVCNVSYWTAGTPTRPLAMLRMSTCHHTMAQYFWS